LAVLLDDDSAQLTPAERKEYARRITSSASRLDKLIHDVLTYNKAVLQLLPMGPIPLSKLLQELLETYPNLHPERADIEVLGELPIVLGSEALLTQCFSNLLGNAVKFVPLNVRPRIRIWAEDRESTEQFHFHRHKGGRAASADQLAEDSTRPQLNVCQPLSDADAVTRRVRIWIEDNGIGISKSAYSRLFGMFQRLHPGYEGTGIGLAIVRKVVERMGGKVGAESVEGKGSRFWVDIYAFD